ncbi:lantibiotic dehydratase [Nonomuraea sp. NPDC050680]|uniref:lantibiotic dehydratase n=1 Tax=Nonomuraea sp. NPDC050680 TaxID=3154630 RepID=UPI0034052667
MRVPMSQGQWWIWRDVGLRSAGFPFSALEDLADEPLAALADDPGDDGAFLRAWETGTSRGVQRMIQIAETEAIRSALVWQNPDILEHVVDWLKRHGDTSERNKRRRRKEVALANYLQRYHAKNETIGAFGPAAWAELDGPSVDVRIGPSLIRARQVDFEDWAVDGLARAFAADPEVRRHLPPALALGVRLHGRIVARPDLSTEVLSADLARVAACCDGSRDLRMITTELAWKHGAGAYDEVRVAAWLAELAERGIIGWRFDVSQGPSAMDELRTQLETLPPASRGTLPAVVDRFERLRADLEQAQGRPEPLAKGLAALDEEFEALTGSLARRGHGQYRAGRRLAHEECRRDVDVTLGRTFLDAFEAPMSLLLTSVRWLLGELAAVIESTLRDVVRQLGADLASHDGRVPLGLVLARGYSVLEGSPAFDPVIAGLRERWQEILDYDETPSRVERTSGALAQAVERAFPAPSRAPWYGAARHSPDVMVAAESPAEFAAGRFFLVMGEMHIARETLDSLTFSRWHPKPERLVAASEEHDHDQPRFVPLYPRGTPGITGRSYPTPDLVSDQYLYLSFGARTGARPVPPHRVWPVDRLVVAESDTGLVVTGRSGGFASPLLDVLGEYLSHLVVDAFQLMRPLGHTPRVTVDRMVIARESWRRPAAEIPVGPGTGEAEAFAAVRAWARRLGLPRHLFWRTPGEPKPIYLDLASPALVNLFAAIVRRARRERPDQVVTLTEMLPDPGLLWLRDAEGRRYTSEFRLVVADTQP